MTQKKIAILSGLSGLGWAVISVNWFIGMGVLLFWGLTGILLGAASQTREAGAIAGALYGFVLSCTYIVIAAAFARPQEVYVYVFLVAYGIFVTCCGTALGWLGAVIRRRV